MRKQPDERNKRRAIDRAYRKTRNGKISVTYTDMRKRVRTREAYKGLELLSRKDFVEWSLNSTEFNRLFDNWDHNDIRTSPSIDRIDPKRGYTLDNMRWLTVSDNAKHSNGNLKTHHL